MMDFSWLFWSLLLVLSVARPGGVEASNQSPQDDGPRDLACPDAQDIFPCVCSLNSQNSMDMNCSEVTSEDELAAVFQANFPSTTFHRLTIFGNRQLRILKSDALGSATFEEFWITDGALELVEDNALIGSSATAVHMVFNFNNIVLFPFSDLHFFTSLKSLDLRHNFLAGFPVLVSPSLQTLYLSHNPLGGLPGSAFVNTPELLDVHLSDVGISGLVPGTFSGLRKLRNVGLGRNQLTHLPPSSVDCTPATGMIDVGYNEISSVSPDAFPGLVNGWVYIHHNHLRSLPEGTWRKLLEDGGYLDPYGNPLHCTCDIAWILRNATFLHEVDVYTTCADGHRLVDLDLAGYEHC
ncbi:oplophorus-luciferin 2-monooxygenase non-catalytic subunit-like [Panulirus ornatus]|uniref:oplophorus-luciferin 2-monooxygenase non-catalytic subunit-like n=1 Tax=Panulirus ornatus TaxID=150431 RepID=UPI003A863EBC